MAILDQFDKQVEIPVKLAPGITYGFSNSEGFKRYDSTEPKYDHHDYWNVINLDVVLNPIIKHTVPADGNTSLEGMVTMLEEANKEHFQLMGIVDSFIESNKTLTTTDGMRYADRVLDQICERSPIGRMINRGCVYTLKGIKVLSRSSDQMTVNVVLETQVQVGVYVYYFMIKMGIQQPIDIVKLPTVPRSLWD